MLYALMRAVAAVALRWFYRDVQVDGLHKIPRKRPILLVVNHPNALVDALLVVRLVPRRVLLTAKSTIFANPIAAFLLRRLGVVPLYRASDIEQSGGRADPSRNRGSFRAVVETLGRGQAGVIFPEGKSHDEPELAPLKSGAARMALEAAASVAPELAIVPIGLTFERKDAPRTRVFVQVGDPLVVSRWQAPEGERASDALTTAIDARLRAITLNYSSTDDAARAVRLASLLAALLEDVPEIGVVDRPLGDETSIARRVDELARQLPLATPAVRTRADNLVRRLDAIQRVAAKHGVLLEDIRISMRPAHGLRFVLREGWLLVIGWPIAVWGRINHWIPFRAARFLAKRSVESASDPAMRTVVAGASLVLVAYLAQSLVVGAIWGRLVALLYLVSLPVAADINFYLSDRFDRAVRRAKAFIRFKRDPALRQRLVDELDALREDVSAFDRELRADSIVASA